MTDVTKTCRDINELAVAARKACNLFLAECKKVGLDIFITETYRSQSRQNYLYEQGRTRSGQKVTWTLNSRHTSRLAWDIAVNKPHDLYDAGIIKQAGEIAKKLGITWGGTWNTPDMPHFEVKADWVAPAGSTLSTKKYHTVAKGDVVSKIAKQYDTTLAKIKTWNKLDDKYTIQIGQKLRVK